MKYMYMHMYANVGVGMEQGDINSLTVRSGILFNHSLHEMRGISMIVLQLAKLLLRNAVRNFFAVLILYMFFKETVLIASVHSI